MVSPQLIDAVGKVGGMGALLLTFGLFTYAILRGGSFIRDAIVAVDKARADDHGQLLRLAGDLTRIIAENTTSNARLHDSVTHLSHQVDDLRRSHAP
jgi:hypothetical protein